MDFEKAMGRLAEISSKMSGGELSLEDSMKLYAEAAQLTKECREYIKNARLQVEKLEAAEFGRTQRRFYLVLIALRTMCADCLKEISPLCIKSLFLKSFSENIKITRFERACVHLHLVKVREVIILSDLV